MAIKALIITSLILLELLDTSIAAQNTKNLQNVFCGVPQETVIEVDPSNHGYFPFYVKLHRCMGSKGTVSPTLRRCVASSFQEFNVQVHERAKNYQPTTLTLRNHTTCTHECVASADNCDFTLEDWDENSCACNCRFPDGPPKELACKKGFRWNRHRCRCECARAPDHCPLRMIWSNEVCGCRCQDSAVHECTELGMGIDVDCKCAKVLPSSNRPGAHPQYRMFITLLIGQAALIIILVCTLVHWVRKGTRQNSNHSPLDRSDSNKTHENVTTPYLEVAVESESTESLEGMKDPDNVSYTAPLSPKVKTTDI